VDVYSFQKQRATLDFRIITILSSCVTHPSLSRSAFIDIPIFNYKREKIITMSNWYDPNNFSAQTPMPDQFGYPPNPPLPMRPYSHGTLCVLFFWAYRKITWVGPKFSHLINCRGYVEPGEIFTRFLRMEWCYRGGAWATDALSQPRSERLAAGCLIRPSGCTRMPLFSLLPKATRAMWDNRETPLFFLTYCF
jgi:hypothetical protein